MILKCVKLNLPEQTLCKLAPLDENLSSKSLTNLSPLLFSGTTILHERKPLRTDYGCDLYSLTTGSRVGVMRSASGDLHYYINGVYQGRACPGLPPGKDQFDSFYLHSSSCIVILK